jgi:hypothetical protein
MHPSEWPSGLIPDEFILEQRQVPLEENGEDSFLAQQGIRILATTLSWRKEFDWTQLPKCYVCNDGALFDPALQEVLRSDRNEVWMAAYFSDQRGAVRWVRLPVEAAVLALSDIALMIPWETPDTLLVISANAQVRLSWSPSKKDHVFLCSHRVTAADLEVELPQWVRIIMGRHEHTAIRLWVIEHLDHLSFYLFCCDEWKDFVFHAFIQGNSEEMSKVAETLRQLDALGHDIWNAHALTVYDDLALAFYHEDPPPWTARLWEYMNPLSLWIDLHTREYMEMVRQRRLKRDAGLLKRLKAEGRLFAEP